MTEKIIETGVEREGIGVVATIERGGGTGAGVGTRTRRKIIKETRYKLSEDQAL